MPIGYDIFILILLLKISPNLKQMKSRAEEKGNSPKGSITKTNLYTAANRMADDGKGPT